MDKMGKKGENGKSVSSSNAHASVFVKSVIDGVPVNDLSEVKIQDQQTEPLVVMWMSTTSVDDYDSFVHVTTEGDAIARTGANNYVTVQELLSAIHLILISYVSKLF